MISLCPAPIFGSRRIDENDMLVSHFEFGADKPYVVVCERVTANPHRRRGY